MAAPSSIRTWRPANIPPSGRGAAHVVNQALREVNQRVDNLAKIVPTNQQIRHSGTLIFGTVNAGSANSAVLNVPGAQQGSVVHVTPIKSIGHPALTWSAFVSSTNQVTVNVSNPTSSNHAVNTTQWQVHVVL